MSSENIKGVIFYPGSRQLEVVYGGGARHTYSPVTELQFFNILTALFPVSAIHKLLRSGQIVGVKI